MATGNSSKINQGTLILPCNCQHTVQDSFYGRQKRVHNGCSGGWKCTVCSSKK